MVLHISREKGVSVAIVFTVYLGASESEASCPFKAVEFDAEN